MRIKSLEIVFVFILCIVSVLPVSAYAETSFSDTKDSFDDLIEISSGYSVEAAGMEENEYNDITRRTIAMILNTALSMNNENIYRIVLESIYGGTDGSVENLMDNAKNVWRALGSVMVQQHSGMSESMDGTNRVYQDMNSVNNVVYALRKVLGERAANLSPGMSVEDLWDEVCKMSEQDLGENGGEFSWDESVAGGGNRNIVIGDQVFFAVTAHLGAKNVHASYEDHYRKWVHGENEGKTELLPREYINDDGFTFYTVTPGSSVTLMWCGLVVDVNETTGAVRAICGNVDLTGLGMTGKTVHFNENGEALNEGLTAESVDGSKGTVKLNSDSSADPEWYITITTKFCHNLIDYNSLRNSMYSSIVLPDGSFLDIDPDDEDLVQKLMEQGHLAEDEAVLVASKVRLMQIYTDLTLSGVPKSEALAWINAIHFSAYKDGTALSAQSILSKFQKSYQDKYELWARNNGVDENNITSLTEFIMYSLNSDGLVSSQIHAISLGNVTDGNTEDQMYDDLSNILNFFYGYSDTDNLSYDLFQGRKYFNPNSVEGQMWKFLQELAGGVVNMGYQVPNAGEGNLGTGSPSYINDLTGPSNDDITIPTSIEIYER